jgi:ribonuclease HI
VSEARRKVELHTDGACSGNPGKGGYGLVLKAGAHRKELSGGVRMTTNNRMELMAAIVGLEGLKYPCQVELFSDSEYVVKGFTEGRALRWKANGWKRERNKPVVNVDLWQRLLALVEQHDVRFHWVRGHSGDVENERCDELAVAAYQTGELGIDAVYEALTANAAP